MLFHPPCFAVRVTAHELFVDTLYSAVTIKAVDVVVIPSGKLKLELLAVFVLNMHMLVRNATTSAQCAGQFLAQS